MIYSNSLPNGNSILDVALELIEQDIPVFPVSSKKTPSISKNRVDALFGDEKYGLHMASTDPDRVEVMFSEPRITGIGMPTGKISGCTVIDVDCGKGKKSRETAIAWLQVNREDTLWGSSVVRTQSGGYHYYCRYSEDVLTGTDRWAKGVDCRNDGGYVVIPPFMGYEWVRRVDRDDWPKVPPALKQAIVKPQHYDGDTPEHIKEMIRLISSGETWHDPVRDIVAHLVGSGWSDAEILRMTCQWTKGGYTDRQTFEQLCVMIAGARGKWDQRKMPVSTEQMRMDKMVDLWNRMQPSSRKAFLEVANNDG